jgi:transcriptional regulator with PAS, ATPase and Fis domain
MEYRPLSAALVIGRSEEADWTLDDDELSRRHARFEPSTAESSALRVVDLDSANGVFINGRRVDEAALNDGDLLRLGAQLFRFFSAGLEGSAGARELSTSARIVAGPAFEPTRALLSRAASTELSVLVSGETGTGKELAAREVHEGGPRAAGPFIAVNCAAIPAEIVESELFGHVKGAFTGADADREGLVRQAGGGTLFLDEVGELPLPTQAKLLRVLQDRKVRPVGGTRDVEVDFRVVSATNRDLRAQVAEGAFRADLFARLAELDVILAPLSQRREDIPLLVMHFLGKHGGGQGIALEALELLCCRPWAFNIRELESAVRRALMLAGEGQGELAPEHVIAAPAATTSAVPPAGAAAATAPEAEQPAPASRMAKSLHEALERHRGDAAKAADELGISRSQLYRRAKKCGLDVGDCRY